MNIVVRSPNWIGDCIMSLPALRLLRNYFPQATIFLVTRDNLGEIFKNLSEINQIISIPDKSYLKIFKIIKKIRRYSFDFGVLFPNSFFSAFVFKLSGVPKLFGYKRDLRGFLLYKKMKFPVGNKHHTAFYKDLVDFVSRSQGGNECINQERFSDMLVISDGEKSQLRSILEKKGTERGNTLVGISPSAAYGSAKEWLPERFVELISKLGFARSDLQFLIFGSPGEKTWISKICENLEKNVLNLAGELSLRESITAISFCSLFISNDSGLMHIASSLRIPTIAIFGPTLPHKTAPLNKTVRILYHPVECAPCKYRQCPLEHQCMKAIEVDEVFKEAMLALSPT